jgi:hypothetical protein
MVIMAIEQKTVITSRMKMVSALLSIIVLIYLAANLVEGGIPAVSWFNNVVMIKSFPFASMASALFMFWVMLRNYQKRSLPVARIIPFFISYLSIVILGFAFGQTSEWYQMQSNYLNVLPQATAYIMIQFGLTSQAVVRLKPKDGPYLAMIITIIFVFLYQSPVGEVIDASGTLAAIGKWLSDVPAGAGYRAMWLGCYLGLTGVIVRIFFGRESMRVR